MSFWDTGFGKRLTPGTKPRPVLATKQQISAPDLMVFAGRVDALRSSCWECWSCAGADSLGSPHHHAGDVVVLRRGCDERIDVAHHLAQNLVGPGRGGGIQHDLQSSLAIFLATFAFGFGQPVGKDDQHITAFECGRAGLVNMWRLDPQWQTAESEPFHCSIP